MESKTSTRKKEIGPIWTLKYLGLETKSLLLQRPGRMLSFYPGQHFLNFFFNKTIHCVQLQKQQKMQSLSCQSSIIYIKLAGSMFNLALTESQVWR